MACKKTKILKGICELPIVKEHPDWWVALTLDGYGSHVNVHESIEIFLNHKIDIVKEEAETLHVNQPYDQAMALNDKKIHQAMQSLACVQLGFMNQWYHVAVLLTTLKLSEPEHWISSFKTTNLHPKHHVGFEAWCGHIKEHLWAGKVSILSFFIIL